jgi:hypothetical protein
LTLPAGWSDMVLAPDGLLGLPTSISLPRLWIFAKTRVLEKKWRPFGCPLVGQDLQTSSPLFRDGIVLATEDVLPAAAAI